MKFQGMLLDFLEKFPDRYNMNIYFDCLRNNSQDNGITYILQHKKEILESSTKLKNKKSPYVCLFITFILN